jgi:phenylacetate-CoA ligase
MLLITRAKPAQRKSTPPGWHYASILQSPDTLLEIYNRVKPELLYGCTTPLKMLAEYIGEKDCSTHYTKRVITTAEMPDHQTRSLLENAFEAEVYDFYGLTEMGLVGWECSEHNGYHIAEDSSLVEYLPVENNGSNYRIIMTNLNLMAMPFIRFESGDVACLAKDILCPCGRGFAKLEKVEGRITDCIKLKDGRILSPYRLTCSLEKLRGIKKYQVIQNDYHRFTVKVETGRFGVDTSKKEICNVMYAVLGNDIKVSIQPTEKFNLKPGRKFRVVESQIL